MSRLLSNSPTGSLSEQAYEKLREDIVFLRLEPGKMLYESELAAEMGMSRTPLREAFRLLQAEELIEVMPQKGVKVAPISERKVEESRQVRETLEVLAFRQVIRQRREAAEQGADVSQRFLQQMRLLLEDQREAEKARDAEAFLQADEAFHQLILEQTGNRTLLGIVLQMRGQLNRLRLLMLRELDQMGRLTEEHERLLEAVTSGKEQEAVAILENHLRKLNQELPLIRAKFPSYFI